MISSVGIVGAGLMGHGIALTFARAGLVVKIHDPVQASLDDLLDRVSASMTALGCSSNEVDKALPLISPCPTLSEAVSDVDLVVEAAPEKLELKQSIFAEIEAACRRDCILASNTSVLPITDIMKNLIHKDRAVGTHWWNPPHMIPLVEVIRTQWTNEETVNATMDVLSKCGKSPVRVEKDVPGFIGNRLQHALWREAISLVENGICDAKSVDTVIKQSFGRRLAVLGPLENADLVGTDLTLDIHSTVLADLEARQGPSPFLESLVAEQKLGMKSGEGFQNWTQDQADAVRARVANHLRKLETILET